MYIPLVTPDRTPMPNVPDERVPGHEAIKYVLGHHPLVQVGTKTGRFSSKDSNGMDDNQRLHEMEMEKLKEKEEIAEKPLSPYAKLRAEKDFFKLRSESMRDVLAMLYQEIDDLKRVISMLERPKTDQQERQAAYDEYCRMYGLNPGVWNG